VVDKEPMRLSDAAAKADDTAAHARATVAHKLARTLRGDLDNIAAKALKKQAIERYPTVAALADDLRHYLDHKPVGARADSLAYRASKFVRRHRVAVGAASMTLLALLAGVIGTTWQAIEARNQRDRALAEIRYSRVNHEVLMSLLDDALRSGATEQWREMLDRAREQLRVRHENDPMSQARVLLMLAGRYATLGDERGESAVTAALEQLEPSLPDPAVRAQIACARADLLLYAREVERARPLVMQAMQSLAHFRDPGLSPLADCYQTDATLAVEEGDFGRAIARATSLVDRFEREGLGGSRLHLYVLSNLQGIYLDTDRDGDVLALHTRLEDGLRAQSALDTLRHFQILDRRTTALVRRGRFVEAQAVLRQTLESADAAAKGKAPAVLRSAIGRKLIFAGATTDGIPLVESALPELEKGALRNHIYFALFALIEASLMDGDPASASSRMQQLQSLMADGRIATRERSEAARLQALLALAGGDASAAGAHIEQMQALAATLPRRARMEALRSELAAVQVAALRGDSEKALRALDNAATIERVTDGSERVEGPSAWRGYIFTLRAGLQRTSGDESAMRTSAQAAIEQFASTVPADHPWRAEAQALLR
jgi:eukaryotic-like serine/threonine-protein kinase